MPEEIVSTEESQKEEIPTLVEEKKEKRWLKPLLFSVLGIIVAAGLVFAGYKLAQIKQVQPGPQPTPTPVVEATPTPDPTATWKTYTNTKYGCSIKYPQEWHVEEDVNYVSPNLPNYTFFYKEKMEFMPGVSIYVVPPTSPEEWLGKDVLKQGTQKPIPIDDLEGTRVVNIPGALEQEWVFLNLDKKDLTYIFYVSGSTNELGTFNLMLSTFRFLE